MTYSEKPSLALIIDDDKSLCNAVCSYLEIAGLQTIRAHNGADGLKAFRERRPQAVVADLRMPVMDGMQFLRELREYDPETPVILMTGAPNLDSAIEAIKNGAYDYIVKPFQLEALLQKVRQALSISRLEHENVVLSKLVSLHEIAKRLTSTHDIEELLDVTLQSCLNAIEAEGGAIQLIDGNEEGDLLTVRRRRMAASDGSDAFGDIAPISRWVVNNGVSMLYANGACHPPAHLEIHSEAVGAVLCTPLRVGARVIGVVSCMRSRQTEPFNIVDLNTMDVLASQASIAISNANLYSSIKQKLKELSLISTYSEQLMGLVDKKDVVRCLFETVQRHFAFDFIGFLLLKKRFHQFLYWSSGTVTQPVIDAALTASIEACRTASGDTIARKRVADSLFMAPVNPGATLDGPLQFEHVVPVVWEDMRFGVVYFGAARKPERVDEALPLLGSLISQTRIAMTNANLYSDMKENYIRTIKALAIAVDAKDTYTHGHSENVMNIAEAIAAEMSADEKWVGTIRDAGLLHDIGKIGIPGYILNKPGPLTYEEFNGIMKTHTSLGANIVKDVPFLQHLYALILHHHEHYDGTGYPAGLKGDAIPLGARILHVADAFEAMTSNRPYRHSLGRKEAIKRLVEEKGKQFDPRIIDTFVAVARKKGWLKENAAGDHKKESVRESSL